MNVENLGWGDKVSQQEPPQKISVIRSYLLLALLLVIIQGNLGMLLNLVKNFGLNQSFGLPVHVRFSGRI